LLDSGRKEGCDAGDRAIDTHVKNLRRKLNAVNGDGDYIFSVYGVDYGLARPSDSGS
jgi:two-component system response regulator BaeR